MGELVGVVAVLGVLGLLSLRGILLFGKPSELLVIAGRGGRAGDKRVGYRTAQGRTYRIPLLEKAYKMDLSNMVIEISAHGAYARGGIPLNVLGVANVKVASHQPLLDNAVERFLGKTRQEMMAVAKATLEGSLRGVLATLTPEEVNEDRSLFNERLVQEVEQDMTALGLTVDTLKIQNITDEVKYLDSIGRIRNADILSTSRIAEAEARADAMVRSAENTRREVEAQIKAEIEVVKADAERRLRDAETRREAVVAEEKAKVAAMVAQAEAEVKVQGARVDQVRNKLRADVIAPARAACEAAEQDAKARVASIVEDGKARADALTRLAESWSSAGDQAREIFLLQKLEPIVHQLTETIADTRIEQVTVIDPKLTRGGSAGGTNPANLLVLAEQIKEVLGVDVLGKLQELAPVESAKPKEAKAIEEAASEPVPEPQPAPEPERPTFGSGSGSSTGWGIVPPKIDND